MSELAHIMSELAHIGPNLLFCIIAFTLYLFMITGSSKL